MGAEDAEAAVKAIVGVVCFLVIIGLGLTGSTLVTVPFATDQQIAEYAAAAAELRPVEVPWQAALALDAVRYHQDFSRATPSKIRETTRLFVACKRQATDLSMDWKLDYVGDALRYQVTVKVPGRIRWSVQAKTGRVQAQLLDSGDHPVSGERVQPGWYVLLVYALEAPAAYHADLVVATDEKVCYGREMDSVMDDLGFASADREMARNILNAFQEAGPAEFVPNPSSPFVWPVSGPLTSPFGYRVSPTTGAWEFHTGTDIAAGEGTHVRAAWAGTVVMAGLDGNYGLVVRIQHAGFETWYGHLSRVNVRVGDPIEKGEAVGAVGNTGRSTGPHLHFEWRVDGKPVDPLVHYR